MTRAGVGAAAAARLVLASVVAVSATAVSVVAVSSVVATPAAAQKINMMGDRPQKKLSAEDIAKQKADEDAYRAALSKIPDSKGSKDPWGNVRASEPAPAKAKK